MFEITLAVERKRVPQATPSAAEQDAFDAAIERLSSLKAGVTATLEGAGSYRLAIAEALGDGFTVTSGPNRSVKVKRAA